VHAWIAFFVGVLVVIGGLLLVSAAIGLQYYGLALQLEAVLAVIFFIIAGIAVWLLYFGVKAQYRRIRTGKEALIHARGIATTELKPKGEVRVLGEFWQAIAQDTNIVTGQTIEVVDMEGMFLVVKAAEQKA
jgi:membrane-bound ClpP family serine protease